MSDETATAVLPPSGWGGAIMGLDTDTGDNRHTRSPASR